MNLFYNVSGIGDVLLVVLSDKTVDSTKTTGDITCLYANEELVGINIFTASTKFNWLEAESLDVKIYKRDVLQFLQKSGIEEQISTSPQFVVGKVVSCEKHPNSDKLNVCQVDVGTKTLQIVCGAKNVSANIFVVVAVEGAMLKSGLFIKPSVLRKVNSNGMICSSRELGFEQTSDGILILENGIQGESFFEKHGK